MEVSRRRVNYIGVTLTIFCVTHVYSQGGNQQNPPLGQNGHLGHVLKPNLPGAQDGQGQQPQHRTVIPPANMHKVKPAGPAAFKLSETPECADDCERLCNPKNYRNNFAILDCLQSDVKIMNEISKQCQHFLWQYKRNLTRDDRFDYAAQEVCTAELRNIPECHSLKIGSGQIIPCIVENMDNITGKCRVYAEKMASIVFSDYRLIYKFVDHCSRDIDKYKCGRIAPQNEEEDVHSQGQTLECLEEKINQLDNECKKQVLRVAELQSDDYHLDKALYYACRDDREVFCADTVAGEGKIFECLFKNKFDKKMSHKCRDMLTVRQQLIAQDVKVEKTFFSACKEDIQQNKCFLHHHMQSHPEDTRRAAVLLCLENVLKDDRQLSPHCIAEMTELRQSLMEDYQISPEIVANCGEEIKKCGNGVERGGKTIHCLMSLAKPKLDKHPTKGEMGPECLRAMEDLMKEADPGSDWTMDRALHIACEPVVEIACRDVPPGDASILNCLMEKVDTDSMTDECEARLMEIQYFIARDFKLDRKLFKTCRKDASHLCRASAKDWIGEDGDKVAKQGHVLACLYRQFKSDRQNNKKTEKVSRACKHEIKRVMRQRAKRIDLKPEIEEKCLQNLGMFCSDSEKYKVNEDIVCLQDNLEHLDPECQDVIANYTEDEDEILELDNILMKSCTPMIDKFCEEELDDDAEAEDIMQCLIDNKHHPDMDEKCKAGIEHHQLISVKDFRFNHKFKEACKKSVVKYCKNKKTKYDVVSCLSEHVRNDTLMDQKHRIEKPCRKQLRVEVLERGENIEFDPVLKRECNDDISKFCGSIEKGNAKVLECLKNHQKKLTRKCHKHLFKREEEESVMGDYKLHQACKSMIKKHCRLEEEQDILGCLKKHKDDEEFDEKCRAVVIKRQINQNTDYRLNPTLMKTCKLDIPKFCKEIVKREKNDDDLEGKVITCLRKQFSVNRLSRECHDTIGSIIKDSALNYMEDAALASACEGEIKKFCADEHEQAIESQSNMQGGSKNKVEMVQMVKSDGNGRVVECLKEKFKLELITRTECKQEIARINQEAEVDINVDPLLHMACQQDLYRFCGDTEAGEGRKMTCLLTEFEDHPTRLKPDCLKLLKQRKDLWELSAQVAPIEGFQQIYEQISASPSKLYILGVICAVIGMIFIVGITCGRASKRIAKQNKMK